MKTCVSKILSAFALVVSLVISVRAAERPTLESLLTKADASIESANHHASLEELEPAKLAIDKALVLDAKSSWAWYYKGLAAYTESILVQIKHDSAAHEAALNEADQALQKSIELQKTGEALGLHANVLGSLIAVRGQESGAQLGPRAGQELAEARRISPHSPRVLMFAGISTLFTPPQWGGDPHRAVKLLEEAIAAFGQEHATAPAPVWGVAEAHVWLGQAYQKTGEIDKAKSEFEQALAIDGNYAWVKFMLLPSVASSK